MKKIQYLGIFLFLTILLVPVLSFNLEPNSISTIDNRKLAENPFSDTVSGDLTKNIENYVNDRIGFRDTMILSYTVLNDQLFGKMVHPSYVYGKDGYVFGAGLTTSGLFSQYHTLFADTVQKMQVFCEDRGVPFLFVLNPAKPAVLTEYIAGGRIYSRDWVDLFLNELDLRGVNYVDNTITLRNAFEEGITVFNQKYDANHWNDIGAFYGTNAMLEALKDRMPNIHVNSLSEYEIGESIMTSLPVSNFPIHEAVPQVFLKPDSGPITDIAEEYRSELRMDPHFPSMEYYINEARAKEGAPSALVFQGSYMNGFGYKYLMNAFSEYIYIHDYQNVLDLQYYFNIFQPDCVIFEVAEYTFEDYYFSTSGMESVYFNPPLSNFERCTPVEKTLEEGSVEIRSGETLTTIVWHTDLEGEGAWVRLGEDYDMKQTDEGYTATVKTSTYLEYADSLQIMLYDRSELYLFQ